MTRWEVERDERGWSIVVYRNGTREEVRSRWTGMSCIDAQVIAKELNRAYMQGRLDSETSMRDFILGD